MKFGPVAVAEAEGAILAHAVEAGGRRLKKGTVLDRTALEALAASGHALVIAARLEPGDVTEDEAARRIAAALVVSGVDVKQPATGRVNIHASADGVFTVSKAMVDALNALDPAVTIATLADHAAVREGQMVATVKIIPFAIGDNLLGHAVAVASSRETFAVHAYRAQTAGLVQTVLPTVKPSVLDKTAAMTAARLARSGSRFGREIRTGHDAGDVAEAIAELAADHDLVIVFGASAMCDPDDVIPAAIRKAGGIVERAGMPVDPGNLLVLGVAHGRTVIGAPGCSRSPKENGFDWVLERILAGIPVTGGMIVGMGVGGLLMEIASRPQPREAAEEARPVSVAAAILAAGKSSRMGGPNKLLARFSDEPLVRRVANAALMSRANGVTIVTGHQADRVAQALAGLDIVRADNPDFASGLASSLRRAIESAPGSADGLMVILGDMPDVRAADLDRLIAAFEESGGRAVIRAGHGGKRGNPVILPRSVFAAAKLLTGDVGARHLIEAGGAPVMDIEIGEAATVDVDTPEALAAAGGLPDG